jgi:hypothetical protein
MFKVSCSRITNRILGLRSERGATDPILVIAAIAVSLVLLVGGSFAVSGIIANGHNLNAKADLDKLAVSETAYYANHDGYSVYTVADTTLEDSSVGFKPTDGGQLYVKLIAPNATYTNGAWAAISKSAASPAGPYFIRTSERNASAELNADLVSIKGATEAGTAAQGIGQDLADLGLTATALAQAIKADNPVG